VKDLTPEVLTNNEYMICRYDNIVIDGREWNRRAEKAATTNVAFKYATGVISLSLIASFTFIR
jgi:hypothetical protein